jgi:6-phosphogluconolactonase/glucosamine-6-phosphate isomerase/deaminase
MMRFIKTSNYSAGAQPLIKRLVKELSNEKRVLWLVSGGSNIPIEKLVMDTIPAELQPYLAIMYDERYGPAGHQDSNLKQLQDAGFTPGKSALISAIGDGNLSLNESAERYNAAAQTAYANADVIIAQLGIGPDGHTSGILPGSPAVESEKLVVGYKWKDFERITFTFSALTQCSAAYVFAFGNNKREQLISLRDKAVPLSIQPAQILKKIPEAYIYNDQIETADS